MTGCDLRYLAEELARTTRETLTARIDLLVSIGNRLQTLTDRLDVVSYLEPLTQEVRICTDLVRTQVDGLRSERDDIHTRTYDTLAKVREHFHEAVDARVESDIEDRPCDCGGEVREAVDNAVEEAKSDIRRAIERALDSEGC